MRPVPLRLRRSIVLLVWIVSPALFLSMAATAQQLYVAPRMNEPLDEGRRIVRRGNVHPLAQAQFRVAGAPADPPMTACCCLNAAPSKRLRS
jgi:hypothetical protein